MSDPKPTNLQHVVRAAILAVLVIIAVLPGSGSLASHHEDEATTIEVATHMRDSGNYLVPVDHGNLVLNRPPLLYWLVALSFHVFGVGLVAARLPSLWATGMLAALIYWSAIEAYGSNRSAANAVMALGSSAVAGWLARLAVPDMLMTCAVLSSLLFYRRAMANGAPRFDLMLMSISVGIAGMAMGLVGVAIAGVPLVALFLVVDRRHPQALSWRDVAMPWTWVPALLIFTWWYVYLLTSQQPATRFAPLHPLPGQTLGGAAFQFFQSAVIQWATGGWKVLVENAAYYIIAPAIAFLPWSAMVLGGLFIGRHELRDHLHGTATLIALAASTWALSTFFARDSHSLRYVLPIAPAIAILAGRFLARREQDGGEHPAIPALVKLGLLLVVVHSGFFVALRPMLRPSLEDLCRDLKSGLTPSDTVIAFVDPKWATFTMTLLGRPVTYIPPTTPAAARFGQLVGSKMGKRVFFVTTDDLAHQLTATNAQLRILDHWQGGWLAEQRGLWEKFVLVESDA